MLNPLHAARCEVGRRAQAWPVLEHFIRNVVHFEGEARFIILPAGDRKDLAADFPDMRPTPLDHVSGRGERPAERIEFFVGHIPHSIPFIIPFIPAPLFSGGGSGWGACGAILQSRRPAKSRRPNRDDTSRAALPTTSPPIPSRPHQGGGREQAARPPPPLFSGGG